MPEPQPIPPATPVRSADWEAFYRDYRKPGYVSGFEITTKLGGGMFGLVFRARKQSIGKDYAIKFLLVDDTEVRRAVLAELEAVKLFAQIDHPNLVSIEDRGEVDGIPFLVMSFAGTQTLKDRIPTDGKPPSAADHDDLLRFFLQACRGIAALHERSLVHFDIKPANIFLKGAVARVGDYGLSKLITHSRGSLSMGRGTPYYMAPEMLQRRGDHRSDIYSLGIVLYELLCGSVPFHGDSEWEVLRKHETEVPTLPVHLSASERAVLQRCLQKDPAARFQSVHDVIAVLSATGVERVEVASERGTPAGNGSTQELPSCLVPGGPPPLPPEAKPQARRRSGFATLLLLGLVVGSITMLSMDGNRSRWVSASSPPGPKVKISLGEIPPARPGQDLAARIDQTVAAAVKSTRQAVQKRQQQPLRELDPNRLQMPLDLDGCREMVDALASADVFSSGYATKLERQGRAAFLAAVAMLQDLDYEGIDDCKRAANVHQLLQQMTAVQGLAADRPDCEPSELDTCRFHALADGWRKFAKQFAKSDADFRSLLVAKGKLVAGVNR